MIFLQYNSSFWLKSPTILTVTSTGRQQMGKHQTQEMIVMIQLQQALGERTEKFFGLPGG